MPVTTRLTTIGPAAFLLIAIGWAPARGEALYSVTDLGPLGGPLAAYPFNKAPSTLPQGVDPFAGLPRSFAPPGVDPNSAPAGFWGSRSIPAAINNNGIVVGSVEMEVGDFEGFYAHRYPNGHISELRKLWDHAGGPGAVNDINNRDQVVGSAIFFNGFGTDYYAVFEDLNVRGSRIDLNTVIPPDSGFDLESAIKIDDDGRIVATGRDRSGGGDRELLLTPTSLGTSATVPEPASFVLFLGVVGYGALRRRSRLPSTRR